eukprot:2009296-Rhodomonas_salina.2
MTRRVYTRVEPEQRTSPRFRVECQGFLLHHHTGRRPVLWVVFAGSERPKAQSNHFVRLTRGLRSARNEWEGHKKSMQR